MSRPPSYADAVQGYSGKAQFGDKFPDKPLYKDVWWVLPFIVQLVGLVACAVYYGSQANTSSIATSSNAYKDDKFVSAIILAVVLPFITATVSLWVMRQYAHCLVWSAMLFGCIMCAVMAIAFFSMGSSGTIPGIIMLLCFLFNIWWIYVVRSRIPFAVAMLETVVDVVKKHPSTIAVSFSSIFVQLAWNVAWLYAAVGIYVKVNNYANSSKAANAVYFFLALSYYWTAQVVSYVVLTTCAGVVAEWYFKAPNQPDHATSRSLKRSMTTSFGSICYGAFLVAFVRALREMVQQARRDEGGILLCIVSCILSCLEGILETVNFWAFTYVSIYGMDYCTAAKSVFELFSNRGFDLIVNEDLISGVLVMVSFISAAVSGIATYLITQYVMKAQSFTVVITTVVAFWLALVFTICALNVIQAAVAAVYVSYAEDPAALANTKPEVYNKLTSAFMERYKGRSAMFM